MRPGRSTATRPPSWKAPSSSDQWLQLDFAGPTAINEFKIKEDPSSSVIRYVIECWDDKASRWVGCFNGRAIGPEFVAPIVGRTTTKVRLFVRRTTSGNPGIAEFEAYHDTTGGLELAAVGQPGRPAAVPAPVSAAAPATAPAAVAGAAEVEFPETVAVGNPGNAADATGFGAVAYEYRIGKYEVTNAQYCGFLNAVAKTDTFGRYHPGMAGEYGGITQKRLARQLHLRRQTGHGQQAGELCLVVRRAGLCQLAHQRRRAGGTEAGGYKLTFEGGTGR